MSDTPNANAGKEAANCFSRIPPDKRTEVLIHLWAQILGINSTDKELIAAEEKKGTP